MDEELFQEALREQAAFLGITDIDEDRDLLHL
jgi:hypothetical protein